MGDHVADNVPGNAELRTINVNTTEDEKYAERNFEVHIHAERPQTVPAMLLRKIGSTKHHGLWCQDNPHSS